jgi:hypothetical protein
MGFADEERYWHSACTAVIAAAILCGSKYAGIVEVPVKGIMDALLGLVNKARDNHRKSVRTAEDVLSSFIGDHYGRFVTVRRDELGKTKAELGLDLTTRSSTRGVVMGRVEIGVKTELKDFYIEEQLMRLRGHELRLRGLQAPDGDLGQGAARAGQNVRRQVRGEEEPHGRHRRPRDAGQHHALQRPPGSLR